MPWRHNVTVSTRVEKVAGSSPESSAIRSGAEQLSYGDLWARSAALAQRLRMLGVAGGDRVALCVPRSAELVIGALAIIRAGAAYVAIDPAYPDERVRWMVEDCDAVAVVADSANAGRVRQCGAPLVLVEEAGSLEAELPAPSGDDVAYVVYTSGSTGQPKGVAVGHDSLINLIDWHCESFGLTAADRCTQIASPGFDAAMWEIWPTLAAGATLLIVPEPLRTDPVALRDWLVSERVTVSFLPTVLAESAIRMRWPQDASLRVLLTGGDALTARPAPGVPFTVVNNYGLSETTVVATSGAVTPNGAGVPSIGRAISGVELSIADEDLKAVAPGAEGELLIGGIALAREYINRPELTAERFVTDGERRWYRTGDRVRLTAEGEIEFRGRVDDQVSIRGFRVEPGEVVAALTADPMIAAAAVIASGATSAERMLVAYVVGTGDERASARELSDRLAASLPAHMIPARYVWLDKLPLTAHGKLDRDELVRLAVPEAPVAAEADADDDVPTAVAVAAMIAELLDIDLDDVGPSENFFLLGGHSMLGAQLIARIEDRFGVELSLRVLFDHPTALEIAERIDAARDDLAPMVA
jgi:amino acid adenylation domain-containing protein